MALAINLVLMLLGTINMYTSFKRNALLIMGSFLTIAGFHQHFFAGKPTDYGIWIMGLIMLLLGLLSFRHNHRKRS